MTIRTGVIGGRHDRRGPRSEGREAQGPSSWDGYAAIVVSGACIAAPENGGRTAISLPDRPDLYREQDCTT
jgi:hypothetical protein